MASNNNKYSKEKASATDATDDGITGTLASTVGVKNPYRYRGYRYDSETGLYYLQSRYYNPEWGRMLNADALGGQVGDLLSHNVFAYCKNNPINYSDPSGFSCVYVMDDAGNYSNGWDGGAHYGSVGGGDYKAKGTKNCLEKLGEEGYDYFEQSYDNASKTAKNINSKLIPDIGSSIVVAVTIYKVQSKTIDPYLKRKLPDVEDAGAISTVIFTGGLTTLNHIFGFTSEIVIAEPIRYYSYVGMKSSRYISMVGRAGNILLNNDMSNSHLVRRGRDY